MKKIINLKDKEKRDILDIYVAGKRNKEDNEVIKAKVAEKLRSVAPNYTQNDFEVIWNDCQMYTIIDNMPPEYINKRKEKDRKDIRSIPISRTKLIEMAKEHFIKEYSQTDITELREDGIIDEIIKNFMRKSKEELLSDFELKRDILTFMQDRTQKGDIEEEQLGRVIDDKRVFAIFLKAYVENLILMGDHDYKSNESRKAHEESINNNPEKKELLQENLDHRAEILQSRENIRKKYLVSDEKAKSYVESGDLKIALAKEYLYDAEGNRIIENSLVEDKLLTIYLELRKSKRVSRIS